MRILYKQYKRYVGVGKAILLGTLLLQSCSSPLDIDTSRERIVERSLLSEPARRKSRQPQSNLSTKMEQSIQTVR
ncbi:MAG: hypothetical protein R3F28_11955 [Candidatus Kapaibacterium sp.]